MSGYIGAIPTPQATQSRDVYTATSNQTTFTTQGYTPNFVSVYLNGVHLARADFTATNGSDVVLASGATADDTVEIVSFGTFQSADALPLTGGTMTGDLIVPDGDLILGSTAVTSTAAELNILDGVTSTATEINQLDAITRGSILYGNSSGVTARLAKGSANTVLTSDGTDISWAAVAGVPAGAVIYHAANSAPTGFLKANGAAISRSTYSDLFSAISTTFGSGDGSSTFNVPDLRGEFARGWDDSRGIDSGRSFGSAQADELKSHNHSINVRYSATFNGGHVSANSLGGNSQNLGSSIASTGGSETRPRNIALLACIKY